MRIIAGQFRRRLLHAPPDAATTRPITDRVKEALFNLVRGHVEGQVVLDVFAGTGSIGLEALSRGAERAIFIERDRRIIRILRSNIEMLGVEERCQVVQADALGPSALAQCPRPAHLVFFDPPYDMIRAEQPRERALSALSRYVGLLDPEGFATLRTPWPIRPMRETEEEKGPPVLEPPQDLLVEGADGPETHVYSSMALHLYAASRAPSSHGDAPSDIAASEVEGRGGATG